jgi:SAM-dependent methyltransferase
LYEGREYFSCEEEEIAYRAKQRALSSSEVEAIDRLLELAPGSKILDAYCGNGRHAVELARRGYEVVGFDTSMSRIAFAQRWAADEGVSASFLVADTRAPSLICAFDAIVILGGSFTHCLDEAENIALLRGLREPLRSGGLLLIDNPNPFRFWRLRHPESSAPLSEQLNHFDMPLGVGEASGFVRYYGADEMARLFREAGLRVKEIFGDRMGNPYDKESPRLILLGKNPDASNGDLGVKQ